MKSEIFPDAKTEILARQPIKERERAGFLHGCSRLEREKGIELSPLWMNPPNQGRPNKHIPSCAQARVDCIRMRAEQQYSLQKFGSRLYTAAVGRRK